MLQDKRIIFCDDSIVRGTQLRDNVKILFDYGAKEVHMRNWMSNADLWLSLLLVYCLKIRHGTDHPDK